MPQYSIHDPALTQFLTAAQIEEIVKRTKRTQNCIGCCAGICTLGVFIVGPLAFVPSVIDATKLNQKLFDGQPVLSASRHGIFVNTDYIRGPTTLATVPAETAFTVQGSGPEALVQQIQRQSAVPQQASVQMTTVNQEPVQPMIAPQQQVQLPYYPVQQAAAQSYAVQQPVQQPVQPIMAPQPVQLPYYPGQQVAGQPYAVQQPVGQSMYSVFPGAQQVPYQHVGQTMLVQQPYQQPVDQSVVQSAQASFMNDPIYVSSAYVAVAQDEKTVD